MSSILSVLFLIVWKTTVIIAIPTSIPTSNPTFAPTHTEEFDLDLWHFGYQLNCNQKCTSIGKKCDPYQTILMNTEERVEEVFDKVTSPWNYCVEYKPSKITHYYAIPSDTRYQTCYYFQGDIIDAANSCDVAVPSRGARLCVAITNTSQ